MVLTEFVQHREARCSAMPFDELSWRTNHRPARNLRRGPFGVNLQPAIWVLARLSLIGPLSHAGEQFGQALLHRYVEAVLRCFGSPNKQHAGAPQNPAGLAQQVPPPCRTVQDLNEQYSIESAIPERQMRAIRLHQRCRTGKSACREGLKHAQRNVNRRVVIAGCDEGPADAPRPAAQVEYARQAF